jgi:hypothetical protein
MPSTKFEIDAGRFSDQMDTDLGKAVVKFLTSHDNLIRMETASELHRPALEPLGPRLLEEFGAAVTDHRFKQFIGFVTRQIMEGRQFRLDAQGVKLAAGNLFTVASRYSREVSQ